MQVQSQDLRNPRSRKKAELWIFGEDFEYLHGWEMHLYERTIDYVLWPGVAIE